MPTPSGAVRAISDPLNLAWNMENNWQGKASMINGDPMIRSPAFFGCELFLFKDNFYIEMNTGKKIRLLCSEVELDAIKHMHAQIYTHQTHRNTCAAQIYTHQTHRNTCADIHTPNTETCA